MFQGGTQNFCENSEVRQSTVSSENFLVHISSHELLRDASVHPQNIATLVHGAVLDSKKIEEARQL